MPLRYGVADGDFARVTTDYGQCTLRVVVSERQQRGMLFAPIHWSEATRPAPASARWWRHSPIRSPASPRTRRRRRRSRHMNMCSAALRCRASRSNCPHMPGGRASPSPAAMAICSPTMPISRDGNPGCGRSRATISPNTRILAAASIARRPLPAIASRPACSSVPRGDAGDWNVVKSLFAADALSDDQRRMLLSGKSADGLASAGPIVCACFGVGRTTICDAIAAGARTAAEIGAKLKAGTNCGSCIPELKRLIAQARRRLPCRSNWRRAKAWLAAQRHCEERSDKQSILSFAASGVWIASSLRSSQ